MDKEEKEKEVKKEETKASKSKKKKKKGKKDKKEEKEAKKTSVQEESTQGAATGQQGGEKVEGETGGEQLAAKSVADDKDRYCELFLSHLSKKADTRESLFQSIRLSVHLHVR